MSNPFFYLWDNARYEGSTSHVEVVDMLHGLEDKSDAPSEAIIKMAEELMPYLEAERENCPEWFESLQFFLKRAQHNTKALLKLEHPEVDWPRLLQIMIPLAGKHNVGMYFDADGMYVLPPGFIYPIPARLMWDKLFKVALTSDPALPKGMNEFKEWFEKNLEKMFIRNGDFRINDEVDEGDNNAEKCRVFTISFKDQGVDIKHKFFASIEREGKFFSVELFWCVTCPQVSDYLSRFKFKGTHDLLMIPILVSILDLSPSGRVVKSVDHAKKIIKDCEGVIFPCLNSMSSLHGLNAIINHNEVSEISNLVIGGAKNPSRLMLSKLARDQKYEEVLARLSIKSGIYKTALSNLWDKEWPDFVNSLNGIDLAGC